MTTRPVKHNTAALDAFVVGKANIDAMRARIVALSDEHFNASPDEIYWGHVGNIADYAGLQRRITDAAVNEGEHAESNFSTTHSANTLGTACYHPLHRTAANTEPARRLQI